MSEVDDKLLRVSILELAREVEQQKINESIIWRLIKEIIDDLNKTNEISDENKAVNFNE